MNLDELIDLQRRRWSDGTPISIEELLAQISLHPTAPDQAHDQSVQVRLSLICSEIALRESSGQMVSMTEYLERFPDLENQLMIQWEVDRLLASNININASTAPLNLTVNQGVGAEPTAQRGPSRPLPRRIGRYEILRELGRGAMGVAYEAWDPELKRPVAIKRLRAGQTASLDELTRIRAEAEAVANIDHANIVKIYDIGDEDGSPFFAMELCTGGNLSERLGAKPLPPKQAADLVRQIALGVAAAHSQRIIHRDLKPGNIVLRDVESWTPKVTDFGLAKSLDKEGHETATGFLLGTPAYMPPEQATGQAKSATVAMDVYALGTILYQCLTGRPPFQSSNATDVLEQVRSSDPISVRRLEPNVPIDLETIVTKCMRREPAQRYASAQQLADDLHNYLTNRPIMARRLGPLEHARSWAKRNPMVAGLLGAITMIVSGSLIGLTWMFLQVHAESAARLEALALRDTALNEKTDALLQREAANAQLKTSEELAQRRYYSAQVSLAQQALNRRDYARAEDLLESVIPKANARDFRGFEWNYLKRILHQRLVSQFDAGQGEVLDIDLRNQPPLILVAGGDTTSGFASLRNYATGEVLYAGIFLQAIGGVAFHPTEDSFIVCRSDGILYLFNMGDANPRKTIDSKLALKSAAWSPDGRLFLVGSERGELGVWDTATWESLGVVQAERGPILRMFFAKDSSRFYTSTDWGGDGKHSSQWKVIDGQPELQRVYRDVSLSDVSADGQQVVGMNWGNLVIAAAATGQVVRTHPISAGPLLSVRFTSDGRELYLASRNDREVRRVDSESLEVIQVYPSQNTLAAVELPSGTGLWASGDASGEVRLWNSQGTAHPAAVSDSSKAYHYAAFLPGERELLLSSNSETVLWDPSLQETRRYSDDSRIVAASRDGRVVVQRIDTESGHTVLSVRSQENPAPRLIQLTYPIYEQCLSLSPSGRYLATRGDGTLLDLFDLTVPSTTPVAQFDVNCVAMTFSNEEDRLACGTQYGEVRAYDLASGQRLPNYAEIQSFWAWGMSAVFSRDDQLLASGNESGTIRVWRADSRELIATLTGNQGEVRCLAFFPDGQRLVSGGSGDLRIWDIQAEQELLSLPISENRVSHLAVNDQGDSILAVSPSGHVHLWRTK